MAYVNPTYTSYQLGFRVFFTCVSVIVLCFYCTKVLCRIDQDLIRQINFEQKGTLALIFTLFLFNDPFYVVHI